MERIDNLRQIKVMRLFAVIMLMVFVMTSCGEDEEFPNAQEIAFELLAGNWTLDNGAGSISVDGTDVSANYPGFSLSFSDGGYTTTNAEELFNATGTWQWINEEASMIRLDDGKEITITTLNLFRFTFTFNYADGGVRAGIPGNYTISVVK